VRVFARAGATLLVCALAVVLPSSPTIADGGTVRLMQAAGPFTITLFTTPAALGVGLADVSVLVQSRASSAALLDARVSITTVPPPASRALPVTVEATHAAATNKLLYAATVAMPVPGSWTVRVAVSDGGEPAEVSCELPVAPAAAELARIWPYLAIPPLAVALFALHQWLAARRRPPAPA
jgi:hypothetical protein